MATNGWVKTNSVIDTWAQTFLTGSCFMEDLGIKVSDLVQFKIHVSVANSNAIKIQGAVILVNARSREER